MTEPLAGHRDFPVPAPVAAAARAWLAGPGLPPPARPAATVMLVRDGEPGVEVFVIRRASSMAFAPDMTVFPGGGVDPRDADPQVPWTGPGPQEWARSLGVGSDEARELVIAAAREVFEECGVLLAGPHADSVVSDLTDPVWDRERDALLSREQSFAELLIRRRLVLRTDLLRLRAHWITPECEPRRYDTWFFAALMPEGQRADDRSSEAAAAGWLTPATALAAHQDGSAVMLPPTVVMMEQLAAAGSAAALLGERPRVRPVMPWPVEQDGSVVMRSPVGPDGHGV